MNVPPNESESLNSSSEPLKTGLFVEHTEGRTRLYVPSISLTRDPPPTAPVFFNPAASLNRDVSVAMTAATGGSTFCDAMCGVGARGVRVANEVGRMGKVTMVDFNRAALAAAKRAAALNGVGRKCEFSGSETTSYLSSKDRSNRRYDYVDLDPFGTPAGQMRAALSSASDGGIVSVTATDTAVLCGVYPKVSARRYGILSMKSSFSHETGIRVLAGSLAREGARLGLGVEPVFAHSTRHYIRIFARIDARESKAGASVERLGYLSWCPHCGDTSTSEKVGDVCRNCGKKSKAAGPLWLSRLTDAGVVEAASDAARELDFAAAARLIERCKGVDDLPAWSFSIEVACSSLKTATVPESAVREALSENGWRAFRTPFEKTGLKTDAPYKEFLEAVKRSALRA